MSHLSESEAEAFIQGRLGREERLSVVKHLLSGCRLCRDKLAPYRTVLLRHHSHGREIAEDGSDALLGWAIGGAPDRQLKSESDLPPARASLDREGATRLDSSNLSACGKVEDLLRLSFAERYREPARMLQLATICQREADQLDPNEKGRAPTADLQARAWTEFANSLRVNEQFDQADEAMSRAFVFRGRGTLDPVLLARMAEIQASIRMDQRRLNSAFELFEMAQNLYQRAGDRPSAGRALVSRAVGTHYDGNPRRAVLLFGEGLRFIDSAKDTRFAAASQQALIHALAECGEFREAGRLLLKSGLRQTFAGEPLNLLKLRWIEGKVLAGLGNFRHAGRAFEETHKEFLQRGRAYDAALVGLELATVRRHQGRSLEVEELTRNASATLDKLGVEH